MYRKLLFSRGFFTSTGQAFAKTNVAHIKLMVTSQFVEQSTVPIRESLDIAQRSIDLMLASLPEHERENHHVAVGCAPFFHKEHELPSRRSNHATFFVVDKNLIGAYSYHVPYSANEAASYRRLTLSSVKWHGKAYRVREEEMRKRVGRPNLFLSIEEAIAYANELEMKRSKILNAKEMRDAQDANKHRKVPEANPNGDEP